MFSIIKIPSSDGVTFYDVSVTISTDGKVSFICNCQAGQKGTLCKHINRIILEDYDNIDGKQARDKVEKVMGSIKLTESIHKISAMYQNIDSLEKTIEKAEKDLKSAKKKLCKSLAEGI